jgi:fatty-acyl-CoA synthase
MRISVLLDMSADTAPGRVAIDGAGGRLTFSELRDAARACAHSLATSPATTVAYLGTNTPAFPVALYGAALAGRPFCPLNYRLPDERLVKQLGRLAPAVLYADATMAARVAGIDGIEVRDAAALAAAGVPPDRHDSADDDGPEAALLLFTSGTSGEPKTAVLTHQNLTSYVMQTVEFMGASEHEAALASVPPYHIAAVAGVLSATCAGRRIVQLESFTPADWVRTVRDFAVTHAMLVPTMLARVLDLLEHDHAGLPALRHLAYGGGRMPVAVIRRALARLPEVDFANAYGLTETSSTLSLLGPEDHRLARSDDSAALARLASVGRPLPGVEVEVRDAAGRAVAAGTPGEIHVRGEQVSGRYADRCLTAADGWFATRDRGWFDADGYLYVDGRLDDVIVRGGENISPGEIEDVLRQHPAVADVAATGEPDEQWGERVVAFVVRRAGAPVDAAALRAFVRERLRSTRTPDAIHFRDELPYNETGKLLRRVLRDELRPRG